MPLFGKKKTSEGGNGAIVGAAAGSIDDAAEVFSMRGREAASLVRSFCFFAVRSNVVLFLLSRN